jgi:hypothetical protein
VATSGLHSWGLTIGDVIDEAAERCGLDPAGLSDRHLNSARRSLNILYTELESEKVDMPFRIERITATLPAGMRGVILPPGTIDVLDVVATVSGIDVPLGVMSRSDYASFANKATISDRPTQYFVSMQDPSDVGSLDGSSGMASATGVMAVQTLAGGPAAPAARPDIRAPMLIVYPRPSVNVALVMNRMRMIEDAKWLGDNADIAREWSETLCAGLAAKMAVKFSLARVSELTGLYRAALAVAKSSISDRGSIVIGGRGFGRSRTWRN